MDISIYIIHILTKDVNIEAKKVSAVIAFFIKNIFNPDKNCQG